MIVLDEKKLTQLKHIQIAILKEYIEICHKHGLQYFLVGGSCLGAVRHQGFIPWDDDIDIGMPRADYDRFLEVAPAELSDGYFLQTAHTDKHYPMNFAKIRNSQTTFLESSVSHLDINHGVFFDIFPMDGYHFSRGREIKMKICRHGVARAFRIPQSQSVIKKLLIFLATLPVRDYHKARDILEKMACRYRYEDCDIIASYFGVWGKKEIFKKEIFGQGSKGIFEGIEVMLPADPHGYCRQLYGDYMKYPPLEKRVTHHYCDVIDLDKSYLYYIKSKES